MCLSTTPFSTQGLTENTDIWGAPADIIDMRNQNFYKIQSGTYFTLQTDDPETKPLPSFRLLELQWFLQRVMGMAGAADVYLPSLSESGSDISEIENSDLQLNNEEDLESEVPDLQHDSEEDPVFSETLSSPAKLVYDNSNLSIHHPKHQEAEGKGEGEGEGEGRQVAMLHKGIH